MGRTILAAFCSRDAGVTWAPGMYAVQWTSSEGIVFTIMQVLH